MPEIEDLDALFFVQGKRYKLSIVPKQLKDLNQHHPIFEYYLLHLLLFRFNPLDQYLCEDIMQHVILRKLFEQHLKTSLQTIISLQNTADKSTKTHGY